MARCNKIATGKLRLLVDGSFKIAKLSGWQHDEEGFEQNYGFPKAGVEVVVAGIHFVPAALRIRVRPAGKMVGDVAKVPIQIFYHFLEGADFMKELKSVGKQHSV